VDRWRRLASRMGQSVWPGKKIAGQRANRKGGSRRRIVAPSLGARPGLLTVRMQGTDLHCMVKLKLFRRGFFFARCAAALSTVSVGTFSRPFSSGRPLKFTLERIL
jgi:hypothetical protein